MADFLPDVYYFNPTCEFAIANGSPNWQPNKLLQKMEDDLSTLPYLLSKENDFVIVHRLPSQNFIESLQQAGILLPDFVLKNDAVNNIQFINLPKEKLKPWGWSPAVHKLLAPLKDACSDEFKKSAVFNWKPEHREIASRKFAVEILSQLLLETKSEFLLPEEFLPEICTSQHDFEQAIQHWREVMFKAPWSSSGRGLQPITKTPVHIKVWEKIMAIIKEQTYAIAEPFLKKVFDFSFQFELRQGKVDFLGISNFSTNKKGQYEGNFLNGIPLGTDERIFEIMDFAVAEILNPLIKILENSKLAIYYEGFFGVDTLIYSDRNNKLRINPCLEINVRNTMGLLSLRLQSLIHENKKGIYRIFYNPGQSYNIFKNEMDKKHPVIISESKIVSGFLSLTDSREDTQFGAYLLV